MPLLNYYIVGTDLSKLGYIIVQGLEECYDCDVLNASVHNSNEEENKVNATVPEVVDDCDIRSTGVHNSDDGQNGTDAVVLKVTQ